MKIMSKMSLALAVAFLAGCATGASELNLKDVPKGSQVFFGHIEFYNGEDRIDGSSVYSRCFVKFENSTGDSIARIATDESSWIFTSAPAGRVFLSSVICNAGFLKAHPQLDAKDLFFDVDAAAPTYFGHLEIHFNYHGTPALGMFGLVGAAVDAATSSGSKDGVEIKIDDRLGDAKLEYGKRYGSGTDPVAIIEAVIKKPDPK